MSKSNISWTEQTWNPIVGCSIVSPGCKNCYAMKMAYRLDAMHVKHYAGLTKKVNGNAVWTGKVALAPEDTLMKPLKRRIPTTYFVNSMGDLFHEDVPNEWIDQVFAVMALCPQHTFQILTKRADRMEKYISEKSEETETAKYRSLKIISEWCLEELNSPGFDIEKLTKFYISCRKALNRLVGDNFCQYLNGEWPLKNVWLGVSAENQQQANERLPHLRNTPAAKKFVSLEPQLEEIDFVGTIYGCSSTELENLDWVIQGCESGLGARPFDLDWARLIRNQCDALHVPYHLKQLPDKSGGVDKEPFLDGVQHLAFPEGGE